MYFDEHKKRIDELATAKKAFLDANAKTIAGIEQEIGELTAKQLDALDAENANAYTEATAKIAIAKAKHERFIAKQLTFDRENNIFQAMDDATNAYSAELAKQAMLAAKNAENIIKALSVMQALYWEYFEIQSTAMQNFDMKQYPFVGCHEIDSLERFVEQYFGDLDGHYNPHSLLGILRFMV